MLRKRKLITRASQVLISQMLIVCETKLQTDILRFVSFDLICSVKFLPEFYIRLFYPGNFAVDSLPCTISWVVPRNVLKNTYSSMTQSIIFSVITFRNCFSKPKTTIFNLPKEKQLWLFEFHLKDNIYY
jgi:hypothetical protein